MHTSEFLTELACNSYKLFFMAPHNIYSNNKFNFTGNNLHDIELQTQIKVLQTLLACKWVNQI